MADVWTMTDPQNAGSVAVDEECLTCGEIDGIEGECPSSKRPCGHHCNCSWIHDCCHWCGGEYDDDGQTWLPGNGGDQG